MKSINCVDCETEWGVLLDPGDTVEHGLRAVKNRWVDRWLGDWIAEREPSWPDLPPPCPSLRLVVETVIWVDEASAKWLTDSGLAEAFLESCWQPVRDTDLPAWWVKGRPTRTAVRVKDCCVLPWSPGVYRSQQREMAA